MLPHSQYIHNQYILSTQILEYSHINVSSDIQGQRSQ